MPANITSLATETRLLIFAYLLDEYQVEGQQCSCGHIMSKPCEPKLSLQLVSRSFAAEVGHIRPNKRSVFVCSTDCLVSGLDHSHEDVVASVKHIHVVVKESVLRRAPTRAAAPRTICPGPTLQELFQLPTVIEVSDKIFMRCRNRVSQYFSVLEMYGPVTWQVQAEQTKVFCSVAFDVDEYAPNSDDEQ